MQCGRNTGTATRFAEAEGLSNLTQVGTLDWYTIDPCAYTRQRYRGSSDMHFLDGGIGTSPTTGANAGKVSPTLFGAR